MQTGESPVYQAFGLRIVSDIRLPELELCAHEVDSFDVEVRLDEACDEFQETPYAFDVEEGRVSVLFPQAGLFRIENGRRIQVVPWNGADPDLVRLYILGTCLGACLLQRKILPLHGSAVALNGKVYAIIGNSGAGKSTMASTLLSLGCTLLSDDIVAIAMKGSTPYVIPSYPQQKLWRDSLKQLGMADQEYSPIFGRESKFNVPVSQYCRKPLPLAGIVELTPSEQYGFRIDRIPRLEQLHKLFCHTYRYFLIPKLGLMNWHFKTTSAILEYIDFFQLERAKIGVSSAQMAFSMLDMFGEEGLAL